MSVKVYTSQVNTVRHSPGSGSYDVHEIELPATEGHEEAEFILKQDFDAQALLLRQALKRVEVLERQRDECEWSWVRVCYRDESHDDQQKALKNLTAAKNNEVEAAVREVL